MHRTPRSGRFVNSVTPMSRHLRLAVLSSQRFNAERICIVGWDSHPPASLSVSADSQSRLLMCPGDAPSYAYTAMLCAVAYNDVQGGI